MFLIAGPTASGKSALAIEMAQKHDGVIINADSMQVYDVLRVLTARPSLDDEALCEHRLFGHIHPSTAYSVARWLEEAEAAIDEVRHAGRVPILTGGTGLYFAALTKGISKMPEIKPEIRAKWRAAAPKGAAYLHDKLSTLDPGAASRLLATDTQRVTRALEVIESSGKSILTFQGTGSPSQHYNASTTEHILVFPSRETLHFKINKRFDQMIEEGGLEEVKEILKLELNPSATAMKAIGVSQLASYLNGEITLETAVDKAKAASRQYAKRQSTWFNNQFDPAIWKRIEPDL